MVYRFVMLMGLLVSTIQKKIGNGMDYLIKGGISMVYSITIMMGLLVSTVRCTLDLDKFWRWCGFSLIHDKNNTYMSNINPL